MKLPNEAPRLPPEHRPLKSLRELEFRLGVDRKVLRALAENSRNQYSPFQQTKKAKPHQRIEKTSKVRDIDNPNNELKQVQKKILTRLLLTVQLPHFLFGAVSKCCVRQHASQHLGAKVVVKMDVKGYYPSITCHHIYGVFTGLLLCSPRLAALLTQLTTFDWHLPQGAPTSPALANLFLASIYGPVLETCSNRQIVPTAWVDDLIFSGDEARSVMNLVRQTLADHGFKLSRAKRVILNGRNTKEITGVRLGAKQIRASKKKLHELRAGIHNLERNQFTARGRAADIRSLKGQLMHVKSICANDAVPLEMKLRGILERRC